MRWVPTLFWLTKLVEGRGFRRSVLRYHFHSANKPCLEARGVNAFVRPKFWSSDIYAKTSDSWMRSKSLTWRSKSERLIQRRKLDTWEAFRTSLLFTPEEVNAIIKSFGEFDMCKGKVPRRRLSKRQRLNSRQALVNLRPRILIRAVTTLLIWRMTLRRALCLGTS